MKQVVARWQNKSGKRWIELYVASTGSLLWKGDCGSGEINANLTKDGAIVYCHRLASIVKGVKRVNFNEAR